jgi:NADH:ubiquinone oxidoreductase subunit 6 (subunit J)
MLNLKIIELNELNWQYSIGILFSLISLIKLIIFFLNKDFNFINYYYNNIDYIKFFEYNNWYSYYYNDSNLSVISIILYRYNYIIFIIISIILLVAMVGVIILTSSKTLNIKEQNIYEQTFRFIKKRKDEYKNK